MEPSELECILTLLCDIVTQTVRDYRTCIRCKKIGKKTISMSCTKYDVDKLYKDCERFFTSDYCLYFGGVRGKEVMLEIRKQEGVLNE